MSKKTIEEIKECYAKEKEDDIGCSNCEVSFWCHLLNSIQLRLTGGNVVLNIEWITYRKEGGLIECGMCVAKDISA